MSTATNHLKRILKVSERLVDGFSIESPVGDWGRGAKNRPQDVETVQMLLQQASGKTGRKEFHPKGIDGKISRVSGRSSTVKAIRAFQGTFMNVPDGVVDPGGRTLEKLQSTAFGESQQTAQSGRSVMTAPHADDGLPSWLGPMFSGARSLLPGGASREPSWISVAEDELGTAEIDGKEHNPRIIEYHATTGSKKTDENPWCASFVNWAVERAGYEGTKSAWSHSWRKWGDGLSRPAVGSVAFIDWGRIDPDRKGKGHVGFVVGKAPGRRIVLLGGNQSDRVRYTAFKRSQIVTYRVPKGYEVDQSLYDLPLLNVKKSGGGFKDTR